MSFRGAKRRGNLQQSSMTKNNPIDIVNLECSMLTEIEHIYTSLQEIATSAP